MVEQGDLHRTQPVPTPLPPAVLPLPYPPVIMILEIRYSAEKGYQNP